MIRSIVRLWIVLISCVYFSPFAASASSIFFDLDRIDDFVFPTDEFAVFIEVEIDAPGVTDVAVTMGTLSIPMELSPDGIWEDANDTVFPSLAALKTAVNGTWTIAVTGGADASTSSFTVNANGLVDGDFPPPITGLSPANGATGVSANALLSWTAVPSQFQFVLNVFAGNDAGEQEALSLLLGESPLSASSWQPPLALPTGPVEWGVFYVPDPTLTVDLVGDINVDLGSITWLPHELVELAGLTGSWPMAKPLMVLASETIVQITVPEPDEVLQSGAALATLGLLVGLRSRKRSFADAAN